MLIMLTVITDDEKKKLNNLIISVSQGDRYALDEVYRIAGGRMLSVALGYMRNKQLAEDVLHDSFIKVVRFSAQFKKNTNAYAWLCTIVRNTALNKIKSENLKRETDITEFFNISDGGLSLEQRDTAILVERALKQLETRERTIIWLRYYNDMTVKGIARIWICPIRPCISF